MGPNYAKINNVCLVILASFAVTAGLIFTRPISVPFVFSLFLFSVASPAVRWFQAKWRLPRPLAVAVTTFFFFVSIALLTYLIILSLGDFIQGADVYRNRLAELIRSVSEFSNKMGYPLESAVILRELRSLPVFSMARTLTGDVFTIVGNIFLILVFFLFLILGDRPEQGHRVFAEIQLKVSQYVATKFLLSLATGVLVGIVLISCRVELALMFAILTLLLNFIPNIGSIVAVALPMPIVVLQFGFGWQFFVVLGFSVAIQMAIGNVLEPKLMGEGMDLHPVTVLAFLMFWGLVWGVAGMFLAVPITAIVKIIFNRIPTTRLLAELMAGRLPT